MSAPVSLTAVQRAEKLLADLKAQEAAAERDALDRKRLAESLEKEKPNKHARRFDSGEDDGGAKKNKKKNDACRSDSESEELQVKKKSKRSEPERLSQCGPVELPSRRLIRPRRSADQPDRARRVDGFGGYDSDEFNEVMRLAHESRQMSNRTMHLLLNSDGGRRNDQKRKLKALNKMRFEKLPVQCDSSSLEEGDRSPVEMPAAQPRPEVQQRQPFVPKSPKNFFRCKPQRPERLREDNRRAWIEEIEPYLREIGVFEFVERSTEPNTWDPTYELWRKYDGVARSRPMDCVHSSMRSVVTPEMSMAEALAALTKSSVSTKVQLRLFQREYTELEFNTEGGVPDLLDRLKRIFADFAGAKAGLSGQFKIMYTLSKLPRSMNQEFVRISMDANGRTFVQVEHELRAVWATDRNRRLLNKLSNACRAQNKSADNSGLTVRLRRRQTHAELLRVQGAQPHSRRLPRQGRAQGVSNLAGGAGAAA